MANDITVGNLTVVQKQKEPLDDKHGKGEQIGILAQDLEKAGLKQAVIDTPEGKKVDTSKLSGALAAATASMHQRIKALEGKKAA